jgi:hypothetical protein
LGTKIPTLRTHTVAHSNTYMATRHPRLWYQIRDVGASPKRDASTRSVTCNPRCLKKDFGIRSEKLLPGFNETQVPDQ